jgi:mRNA interferase MazF
MNPRHGEVWLVDMGMAAKTRPAVVLIADNLDAPRTLIIHIPITRQNRGSELEVPLGHLPFLDPESSPTCRPSARCHPYGLKNGLASCWKPI